MAIVRVALDVPLPRLFDYRSDDAAVADAGRRILVPFGKKKALGLIVEIAAASDLPEEKIRPAEKILRDLPALSAEWLALARFCSSYYQKPLGEVIFGALPPRFRTAAGLPKDLRRFELTPLGETRRDTLAGRSRVRRRILERLSEGPAEDSELRALGTNAAAALRSLEEAGAIEIAARERSRGRFVEVHRLTDEQSEAASAVTESLGSFRVFLLFGVTGSGKTEVYLHLVASTLAAGGQALVLVPEIALTPALEAAFRARFPGTLLAMQHSAMPEAERTRAWMDGQSGRADIVLGTRLAVFAPMPRLALIVVDEEQDASFKQQDSLRYSARDVAILRAQKARVPVVLASATPSIETFHRALTGRYRLLRLSRRAHADAAPPAIMLIDTRSGPMHEGLSEILLQAIAQRLDRGEQSMVFLNRRGYAPVLACPQCGWISGCPRCSVSLVVHLRRRVLLCHRCGLGQAIPRACPVCGNLDLEPVGRGTQRLEAALAARFPRARVLRIDSDSVRARSRLPALLAEIGAGGADILVGTQMLAKGHHFEQLTLVGVVNADSGLFAADYRAAERLFSQLEQVTGRSGRADRPGEALVQTRYPDHPLYQALLRHDFEAYARTLLEERRQAGFPPFMFECALRAEAKTLAEAMAFLVESVNAAPRERASVTVFDPAPMTLHRLAGWERAQVVVQAASRPRLQAFLREWSERLYQGRARRVRWHLDVDPIEF